MRRYSLRKMSPILIVITLLVIIITPTTLQPSLATVNLSANTTTTDIKYNSFTLTPSNQSSLADKTNVTLRGTFIRIPDEKGIGNWRLLLQPALDELNRRRPDMNIQIEYIDPGNEP